MKNKHWAWVCSNALQLLPSSSSSVANRIFCAIQSEMHLLPYSSQVVYADATRVKKIKTKRNAHRRRKSLQISISDELPARMNACHQNTPLDISLAVSTTTSIVSCMIHSFYFSSTRFPHTHKRRIVACTVFLHTQAPPHIRQYRQRYRREQNEWIRWRWTWEVDDEWRSEIWQLYRSTGDRISLKNSHFGSCREQHSTVSDHASDYSLLQCKFYYSSFPRRSNIYSRYWRRILVNFDSVWILTHNQFILCLATFDQPSMSRVWRILRFSLYYVYKVCPIPMMILDWKSATQIVWKVVKFSSYIALSIANTFAYYCYCLCWSWSKFQYSINAWWLPNAVASTSTRNNSFTRCTLWCTFSYGMNRKFQCNKVWS